MLAGDQSPLQISGQSVGALGWFLEQGHTGAGDIFHPPVVVNVTEQQMVAFLPPKRPLSRAMRSPEPVCQVMDRLRYRNDFSQRRIQLFDPLGRFSTTVIRHSEKPPLRRLSATPDGPDE